MLTGFAPDDQADLRRGGSPRVIGGPGYGFMPVIPSLGRIGAVTDAGPEI